MGIKSIFGAESAVAPKVSILFRFWCKATFGARPVRPVPTFQLLKSVVLLRNEGRIGERVRRRVERDLKEASLRTNFLLLNILNKAISSRTIE